MISWDDLGDALVPTLRDLDDRSFVIIEHPSSGIYVQYQTTPEALHAETTGHDFLRDPHQLTPLGEATLLTAGWTPPGPGQPNWTLQTPLPALSSEYRHLAQATLTALRDTHAITSPDELTLTAWQAPEEPEPGRLYGPGEIDNLDPGQNPLPLPELPIRPATP